MACRHLLSDKRAMGMICGAERISLFLDYDGTLAPIAPTPERARLPAAAKEAIARISRRADCMIAIVSGRSLRDIRSHIGLARVVYAGSHGSEIAGPGIVFKRALPVRQRRSLTRAKRRLRKELGRIEGVLIEDKGAFTAVHYRLVPKGKVRAVVAAFYRVLQSGDIRRDVRIMAGKRVLEMGPTGNWHKGKAVLWLLARARRSGGSAVRRALPIYVGDDRTDEDAFQALARKGMTIRVGKKVSSHARYYLKNTTEVVTLLSLVAGVCGGQRHG